MMHGRKNIKLYFLELCFFYRISSSILALLNID